LIQTQSPQQEKLDLRPRRVLETELISLPRLRPRKSPGKKIKFEKIEESNSSEEYEIEKVKEKKESKPTKSTKRARADKPVIEKLEKENPSPSYNLMFLILRL